MRDVCLASSSKAAVMINCKRKSSCRTPEACPCSSQLTLVCQRQPSRCQLRTTCGKPGVCGSCYFLFCFLSLGFLLSIWLKEHLRALCFASLKLHPVIQLVADTDRIGISTLPLLLFMSLAIDLPSAFESS